MRSVHDRATRKLLATIAAQVGVIGVVLLLRTGLSPPLTGANPVLTATWLLFLVFGTPVAAVYWLFKAPLGFPAKIGMLLLIAALVVGAIGAAMP